MWRRACIALVVMTGCFEAVPQELRTFCEDAEAKRCAYDVRCGLALSDAACRASIARQKNDHGDACELNRQATYAGRMRFDSTHAQSCYDAWDGECSDLAITCTPFSPAQNEGEECSNHLECALDLYCDAKNSCPGRCARRKAEGETAFALRECQPGLSPVRGNDVGAPPPSCQAVPSLALRCDTFTPCDAGFHCLDDATCVADGTGQRGDACGVLVERFPDGGWHSEYLPDCRGGLACTRPDAGAWLCDSPLGPNSPCMSDEECITGLACRDDVCSPLGEDQQACWANEGCALPLRCVDYACERPTQHLGEECFTAGCLEGACTRNAPLDPPTCKAWESLCNTPR